ncbi:MAG TPA: hypothetical protein VK196_14610 [Magnetospirillum sp.]|nr:hypothetical protein [Magnetospirillum sp.]
MKYVSLAAVAALLAASPVLAQTGQEPTFGSTVTQAAGDVASKVANDALNKAIGLPGDDSPAVSSKAKKNNVPNLGRSDDHRKDADHGHKGKN